MIRLDKFLAENGFGSRKDVKKAIRKGIVKVNGEVVLKDDMKLDEVNDIVTYDDLDVVYQKHFYFMLNKPDGYICENEARNYPSVFELIAEADYRELFTVGRLDVDTTGLLLISDDGDFVHHVISPKHNVDKVYECELAKDIDENQISLLEKGIEFKDFTSLPSRVEVLSPRHILLTIHEGKFHQVKRMFLAVGNEVLKLNRVAIGNVTLDPDLQLGDYRELSEKELNELDYYL